MPRYFPILWQGTRGLYKALEALGCPHQVPWGLVEPHRRQAMRNHAQTLECLADRGGLSPAEMLAVLHDVSWRDRAAATDLDAVVPLKALLQAYREV